MAVNDDDNYVIRTSYSKFFVRGSAAGFPIVKAYETLMRSMYFGVDLTVALLNPRWRHYLPSFTKYTLNFICLSACEMDPYCCNKFDRSGIGAVGYSDQTTAITRGLALSRPYGNQNKLMFKWVKSPRLQFNLPVRNFYVQYAKKWKSVLIIALFEAQRHM